MLIYSVCMCVCVLLGYDSAGVHGERRPSEVPSQRSTSVGLDQSNIWKFIFLFFILEV